MHFHNKHIVITGGTSGIGLALVQKLAKHNDVIVISRKGTLPEELFTGRYPVALYHANLAKKSDIESQVGQIQKNHGSIDALFNNAAIQCTAEFLSDAFNYDAIQTEIDINFTAICHLTYLCLPMLLAAEKGQIININSGLAITPKRASAIYCATKSALDSFSQSLHYQLENTTIDVQQVFLPLVQTPMTAGRGTGKLLVNDVASRIIRGAARNKRVHDIGKVRLLRLINYIAPPLARRIMKAG